MPDSLLYTSTYSIAFLRASNEFLNLEKGINSILNQQQIASHFIVIRYHRAERGLVHVLDELGENRVALTPRPVGPVIIIVAACNCTFKLKYFNAKTQKQNSEQLSLFQECSRFSPPICTQIFSFFLHHA